MRMNNMTTKLLASITVLVLLTGVVSTSMIQSVYAVSYVMDDKAKAAKAMDDKAKAAKAMDDKAKAAKAKAAKAMDDKAKAAKKPTEVKKDSASGQATGKTTSNAVTVDITKDSSTNTSCADKCYTPNKVQIKIDGTVTWKNVDTLAHTVTSEKVPSPDGSFDSGMINAGGSFNHKFNKAGAYDYYCMVHPWMKGTVTVS